MAKQSGHWPDPASRFDDVSVSHGSDVRFERTFVNVENVQSVWQRVRMSETSPIGQKLRSLYEMSGLSLEEIAKRAGYKGRSSVQVFFSGDYDKPNLSNRIAVKLASAFDGSNIDPSEILALSDAEAVSSVTPVARETKLKVVGEVRAGAWLEQTQWIEEDQFDIDVGPNPAPGTNRFAVRMSGNSMDKTIPSGAILECLEVQYGGITPQDDDYVIVERTNHDLTELTCKKLVLVDGKWLLKCESYQDEYQYTIDVGDVDEGLHVDNEVKIIGLVIEAHVSLFKRRL